MNLNTIIRNFIRNTNVFALKISKRDGGGGGGGVGVGVYFGMPC